MFYVYWRHIGSGREGLIDSYETEREAVHKIASCYAIDAQMCQQDEYYYFMKRH